jgi:hypothetical protein
LTRYGLKNQHRLICPKRWQKWQAPPQFQLPLASGFAANMSFRASCNAGQPHFTAESWACWRNFRGKKIAAIAEPYYAQIAPHLYCGPVVAAANIQLAASIPNFLILESIQKMDGFHAALLTKPLCWEDGHIIPPTTPGLGIELNMDVVAQNRGMDQGCISKWRSIPLIRGATAPLPAASWRQRYGR